ncbi:hypothetical protein ACSTH1_23845, partial [Vibrio parahaemolyticus]
MSMGIVLGTAGQQRSVAARSQTSLRARAAGDEIDQHIRANFYPTPPEATRALLSVETFDGSIWEPACGKGHIADVLKD